MIDTEIVTQIKWVSPVVILIFGAVMNWFTQKLVPPECKFTRLAMAWTLIITMATGYLGLVTLLFSAAFGFLDDR